MELCLEAEHSSTEPWVCARVDLLDLWVWREVTGDRPLRATFSAL
jgi:hypothetical protein